MVRVHTHVVVLQVKGVLAELDVLEFILVEVRPTPQPCIDHMREPLPARHLGGTGGGGTGGLNPDLKCASPDHR